ncbi:MAG: hypothetical protein HW413_1306, partial [Thermoleophilia bacterium]|nr:hypothetical protein [Thermoleophilia bacterium]
MAPPRKLEGSWGIDPVPVRLRVLVISFGLASIVAHFSPRAVDLGADM